MNDNEEILFQCPICQQDLAGNHAWNCPMNPINMNIKQTGILKNVNTYATDNTQINNIQLTNKLNLEMIEKLVNIIDLAIKEKWDIPYNMIQDLNVARSYIGKNNREFEYERLGGY